MDDQSKFKVVDKRPLNSDGNLRPEAIKANEETKKPAEKIEENKQTPEESIQQPPEIDFITFILSLSTQAMCFLGQIPNPENKLCQVNLPLAKQTIDIINMLLEKTKGNLESKEEKMLDEILYNLRLVYVEKVKGES